MPFKKREFTKQQVAILLYNWLYHSKRIKQLEEVAVELNFDIKNKANHAIFTSNFFIFDLWLLIKSFEQIMSDADMRNECLDVFLEYVFDNLPESSMSFASWRGVLSSHFEEYGNCMQKESLGGASWKLSKLIFKKMFNREIISPFDVLPITNYISECLEALQYMVKKLVLSYEIR